MQIVDTSDTQQRVLYASSNTLGSSGLTAARRLTLGDHVYALSLSASEVFDRANHSSMHAILAMGVLLSALLSALLYMLVSQRQRALKLVEQRTVQLRAREQELRGAHGQLRSVLNAATQVAIIATDLRGVINTFNAGAEQMLGFTAEEVLGHMTLDRLHVAMELDARAEPLSRALGKRIPASQAMLVESPDSQHEGREWTLVRKDGSQLTVNMLPTVLLDDHGLWVGHLAIYLDVTEQKRAYEALAVRDRLLKNSAPMCRVGSSSSPWNPRTPGVSSMPAKACAISMKSSWACCSRMGAVSWSAFILWTWSVRASIRLSALQLSHWREEYRAITPTRPALDSRRSDAGRVAGRRYALARLCLGYFGSQTGRGRTACAVHHRLSDRDL